MNKSNTKEHPDLSVKHLPFLILPKEEEWEWEPSLEKQWEPSLEKQWERQ
jgi:hypothetical protein